MIETITPETCTETTDNHGKVTCGQPVTDQVEWDMHPDGVSRPDSPVTRRVCAKDADALMAWRASHLSPRRTAIETDDTNEEWANELARELDAEFGTEEDCQF